MRFSIKLFLTLELILILALALFCTALVHYDYRDSVQQALKDAYLELRTIQMSLQLSIHTYGESNTINLLETQAWHVSYGKDIEWRNGNGVILFSNDAANTLTKIDSPQIQGTSETVQLKKMGGDAAYYIIEAVSVFSVGNSTYQLSIAQSGDAIVAHLHNQLRIYQYTYILVVGISSLVLSIFTFLFTRPVTRLAAIARRIADGSLSERTDIKTKDEIGQLGKDFNYMAQSIEEKVNRLNLEAEKKDAFIANFAHEIKTPMTSILGYADMIFQSAALPADVHAASEYILNESLRLEALSHKLMELYVLDKQDFVFTEVFAPDYLQALQCELGTWCKKYGIQLDVRADAAYIGIECDLFTTMMTNLMDNAAKAGAHTVQILGRLHGEIYTITLTDDGCGMDQKELARIKDAFYMVDKSRSRKQHGAGLGLSICEKTANLHGASLHFESTKGEGTRVTFDLKGGLCDEKE